MCEISFRGNIIWAGGRKFVADFGADQIAANFCCQHARAKNALIISPNFVLMVVWGKGQARRSNQTSSERIWAYRKRNVFKFAKHFGDSLNRVESEIIHTALVPAPSHSLLRFFKSKCPDYLLSCEVFSQLFARFKVRNTRLRSIPINIPIPGTEVTGLLSGHPFGIF
jgi:hypothetical protein